jgi:cation:H+ antiporter
VQQWDLPWLIGAFLLAALVIAVSGTRLTAVADRLADRAGFGEALTGGVLLGAVTSLSGSVLSVSAAWGGDADLALSNAYGGIAIQTLFLTIADATYRKVNLEHAAASAENILQSSLLVCLLSILIIAAYSPSWTFWGIHPATPILLLGYIYGIRLVQRSREMPMWRPRQTRETREDVAEEDNRGRSLARLLLSFSILGAILGVTGWLMEGIASGLVARSGISAVIVGTLFTSLATSLPELVTTVAAVRRGALTLAFSSIVGGNAYDTLFAAFSDVAYRSGSIYHAADGLLVFWVSISTLMTATLIMGMLVREKRGIANIGFESFLVVVFYLTAVGILLIEQL